MTTLPPSPDSTERNERRSSSFAVALVFIIAFAGIFAIFGYFMIRSSIQNKGVDADTFVIGGISGQHSDAKPVPQITIQIGDDPWKGAQDAPITIVEFSDFECPFCKQAFPILQTILRAYPDHVRLVYLDFPLTQIHKKAFDAAVAAECAYRQNMFWPMHDRLFQDQQSFVRSTFLSYAEQLQLDTDVYRECLDSQSARSAVYGDIQQGRRFGITGTPTFFINGVRYEGVLSIGQLSAIIEALLQ